MTGPHPSVIRFVASPGAPACVSGSLSRHTTSEAPKPPGANHA